MERFAAAVLKFLFRVLFLTFGPTLILLLEVINKVFIPLLGVSITILLHLLQLQLFWATLAFTLVVTTVWRYALLLERGLNTTVSHIGTAYRRRALVGAVHDSRSYLYVRKGLPGAVSADVLSMIDEYVAVRFEVRRWLTETLLMPLVLNPF